MYQPRVVSLPSIQPYSILQPPHMWLLLSAFYRCEENSLERLCDSPKVHLTTDSWYISGWLPMLRTHFFCTISCGKWWTLFKRRVCYNTSDKVRSPSYQEWRMCLKLVFWRLQTGQKQRLAGDGSKKLSITKSSSMALCRLPSVFIITFDLITTDLWGHMTLSSLERWSNWNIEKRNDIFSVAQ